MALYARLNDGVFSHTVDLTAEHYAALQANGKDVLLRTWSEDAKPVPTATQVLVNAGIVITATDARQTWALRDKTQAELDAEENEAERVRLRTVIANLAESVAAPNVTGTAAERIGKLEARTLRAERICLWLLRRFA